jgi:hypothetical protein
MLPAIPSTAPPGVGPAHNNFHWRTTLFSVQSSPYPITAHGSGPPGTSVMLDSTGNSLLSQDNSFPARARYLPLRGTKAQEKYHGYLPLRRANRPLGGNKLPLPPSQAEEALPSRQHEFPEQISGPAADLALQTGEAHRYKNDLVR